MEHDTRSHYVKNRPLIPFRRPGVMDRATYLTRAKELAMRGKKLPQTILTDKDVRQILAAKVKRERLRAMINDRYGNDALAEIFGVSSRCIERAMARETHAGVV